MNSTIGAASNVPPEEWFATSASNLPHIVTSFLSRYRPELDLLWVLVTYAPFLAQTYTYTSTKHTRARNYPYVVMMGHIFIAPLYVLRWHARYAALRVWPKPELLDLVLFTTFWISSVGLEFSQVKKGPAEPLFRAGFQVAIAIHGACFAAAWLGGRDPTMFRATVKTFNWFASFRGAMRLLRLVDPRLQKDYKSLMSLTILTSGSYAFWEAGVPSAAPAFLLGVGALVLVKRALVERTAR